MATISSVRHRHDTDEDNAAATLIAREAREARVERHGRIIDARVAFGCIVQPEPGDRVLISVADGTTWITSVLERYCDAPMRLWAEADMSITSARGHISLLAAGSVNVDAAERARLTAPEIELQAGIGRLMLDELLLVGRRANVHMTKIRHVSEMIETFAEHLLTRVRRSNRFVEESDQLRAGDIDQRAQGTLQMRAETMLMSADTVVRVDAEQIHMG